MMRLCVATATAVLSDCTCPVNYVVKSAVDGSEATVASNGRKIRIIAA
jgi:hypothetical protein